MITNEDFDKLRDAGVTTIIMTEQGHKELIRQIGTMEVVFENDKAVVCTNWRGIKIRMVGESEQH